MKRRDFLWLTANATGALLPGLAWSQSKPCPPPTVSATGGSSASSACANASGALADWLSRSSAPGVIWANRFSSPTDGGLYWAQKSNNPGSPCRFGYLASEGVIGDGCLELFVKGGSGFPVKGGWARPLAPVVADSNPGGGRVPYPEDVNNAGLELLPFKDAYSVIPGDPAGKAGNIAGGYFTHPEYYAKNNRVFTMSGRGSYNEIISDPKKVPDGIFIQYRVKFPTLPNGDNRLDYTDLLGKLMMLSRLDPNNTNNEIVTNVMPKSPYLNRFFIYSDRGAHELYSPDGKSGPGAIAQPGGAYNETCVIPSDAYVPPASCWTWPKDEWVTVLMQVIPGRNCPGGTYSGYITTGPYFETGIRVWVARAGAKSYTKIWDKVDYAFNYNYGSSPTKYSADGSSSLAGQEQAYGFNGVRFEVYANPGGTDAVSWPKDVWVLHDQVICSTQWIPCPVV